MGTNLFRAVAVHATCGVFKKTCSWSLGTWRVLFGFFYMMASAHVGTSTQIFLRHTVLVLRRSPPPSDTKLSSAQFEEMLQPTPVSHTNH